VNDFKASTRDDLRRNNLSRLIRHLHLHGAVSRSDLVGLTGLNRSTVGVLVSELSDAGLVREVAGRSGGIGRPSLVVEPIPESAVVVTFDLRVERTHAALVGLGGRVLARADQRHRRDYRPQTAVKHMATLLHELLDAVPSAATWVGTGLSVPGVIDPGTGHVLIAPNLGWRDVPIRELLHGSLQEAFGVVPVTVVGNDADFGAYAEYSRGAAVGQNDVLYLSGEVGIGGGIVSDGRVLSSAGRASGEVGHMVINPDGRACHCGSRGCWETEIGRDAVLRAAHRSAGDSELAALIRDANAGDPDARAAMGHSARWLDVGLANLVNVLNPEAIVLGGHLGELLPYLPNDGSSVVATLPASTRRERLHLPALGGDSTLLGAAETAFESLLDDPLEVLTRRGSRIAS
jgi:predicted NBD/HSP70 family sugar kinase